MDIVKKIMALLIAIPCYGMQQNNVPTLLSAPDFEYIKNQITEIVKAEYHINIYLNKIEFDTTDYLLKQKINQLNEIKDTAKKNLLAINTRLNSHQREWARELYAVQEMYIIACCDVTMSNRLDQALLLEQKIRKKSFDNLCNIINSKIAQGIPQKHVVDKYYETFLELQRISLQCKNLQIDSLLNDSLFNAYATSKKKELILKNSLKIFYDKQPDNLKIQYKILEKTIEQSVEIYQKKDCYEKHVEYTRLEIGQLNCILLEIKQCEKNDTRENRIKKRDLQTLYDNSKKDLDIKYDTLCNKVHLTNIEFTEHYTSMENTKKLIRKLVDQTAGQNSKYSIYLDTFLFF